VGFLGCTDSSFLNRMGYSLIVVCVVGAILTIHNAAKGGESVVLGDKGIIEMKTSGRAKAFGWAVIAATVALYILFW
jgi:SSS family solute:Na+ symporter